ncbi:MAG: GAF domain-containing protein [Bacteroidales bacterium]
MIFQGCLKKEDPHVFNPRGRDLKNIINDQVLLNLLLLCLDPDGINLMGINTIRILLIEDDLDDVLLLKDALFEVKTVIIKFSHVDNLSDGLTHLAKYKNDVILLDLNLPDSRGLETLKSILNQFPRIPVVVLSGLMDDFTTLEAVKQGAQDYLVKGEIKGSMIIRVLRYAIERKQTEELLRTSEARYRTLVETSPDGIALTDLNGKLLLCNQKTAHLHGYEKPEALYGLDVFELIAPEERQLSQQIIQKTLEETGFANAEYTLLRKDGSRFPAELSAAIIRDTTGMPEAFIGITRDITQRKLTEISIKREAIRSATLVRTASQLNAQHSLEIVIDTVCRITVSALSVTAAYIFLLDESGEELSLAGSFGLPNEIASRIPSIPQSVYKRLTFGGKPLIISDMLEIKELPGLELFQESNVRTFVSMPMIRNEQIIGTLNINTVGSTRVFDEDELILLSGLADQTALAITNALLVQEINKRASQLALLYDAGLTLNSTFEPDAQLEFLIKIATDMFHADHVSYYSFDPLKNELLLISSVGYKKELIEKHIKKSFHIDDESNALGWVYKNLTPLNLPDVDKDARYTLIDPVIRSELLVPIIHNKKLLGVFCLSSQSRINAFSSQDERLFLLFTNQAAVAIENARLFRDVNHRLSQILTLQKIDQIINASFNLPFTLKTILEEVTDQLGVDAADLLLMKAQTHTLEYTCGRGFRTSALQYTSLLLGDSYAGRAALEKQIIQIRDLRRIKTDFLRSPTFSQEGFVCYYGVPLMAKGEVQGVLEVFNRSMLDSDKEWLEFLETLAGQAAIAISNRRLFDELEQSNVEMKQAYDATIEGWSRALDLRDKETEGHTVRVTEVAIQLARDMNISEDQIVHLRRGALLHDIGKLGIPDSILLKPGKLTEKEWKIMRMHPQLAYNMLSPITYLFPSLDIPYCHHEKWNGSGYPRGLKEKEIPLAARLFTIVDVWDALRSNRPYRVAWPEGKVIEYLNAKKGIDFDPEVVDVFLKAILPLVSTIIE